MKTVFIHLRLDGIFIDMEPEVLSVWSQLAKLIVCFIQLPDPQ